MTSPADRRALLAGLFTTACVAALPAAARAQLPSLPALPRLPRAPRLPFGRRDASAPPRPPKLSGKRPDLAAILKETGAPAVGAAAVSAKGVSFLGVAGLRRIEGLAPVTARDAWRLGGCTETFTAAACARLVEKGVFSLSTRLPTLFPGMKLDPGWADTRLEDILAHRAGFTDVGVITVERVTAARADTRPAPLQRRDLALELLSKPPTRPAGAFEPSKVGYVIIASALEGLTRKSYEGVVEDEVFKPLEMQHAGFGGATLKDDPSGHQLGKDGKLHATPPDQPADLPVLFASAAGAHANLEDWAKFARMFLNDGGHFLKPETLERLCRPWGGGDGETGASGFAVLSNRSWADGVVLLSDGSNGLWRARMEIAPEKGLAVLSVSNAEEGGGTDAVLLAATAIERAYGAG